ncbi:MAG: cobalamin-binding protein [Deltaproteobacteria bacterium]|nr:cobalamin-binding protein [Deltaproteobacteria bacterium]
MKDYRYPIIALFVTLCIVLPAQAQTEGRTVIDQLGRNVVLSDNPVRIVSLAPNITEIVFALGQEHRLIGVTRFSDFPPEAKRIPSVGSYVNLDLEKIVSLRPDLCIATKDGNPREVASSLESLQIPVYAVNPRNLDSVMDTIVEMGRLLNVTEKAGELVENMRSRIERVDSMVSKTEHRPRVFFQIGVSPIVSVGTNTYIHELIVRAGGRNLAAGHVPYPRFSREQVLTLSPEVFIITSMEREKVFEKVKAEWRRWSDLPAVRNDRIILVDSNILDRPTPRMVDGLELLVKVIHPELFISEAEGQKP